MEDAGTLKLIAVYRKKANWNNRSTLLLYLVGFRHQAYRRRAVALLALGDTAVDVGCGTGLNFPLLQQNIGPSGKIIGVDLSDAMLCEAKAAVLSQGWRKH